MREGIIKTVLLVLNVAMWASGWAVLAVGVHLMSGEHGRQYAAVLLGDATTEEGTGTEQVVNTANPWLEPTDYEDTSSSTNSILEPKDPFKYSPPDSRPTNTSSGSEAGASSRINLSLEAILLVMGSVIVMAGLVGCIASSQNDRTLMLAYCCLMIVIGVGNGGTGIWCFTNSPHNITDLTVSSSPSSIADPPPLLRLQLWYGSSDHLTYTEAVDRVQEDLSCCGLRGPSDYAVGHWHRVYSPGKNIVPPSCCHPTYSSNVTATSIATTGTQCEDSLSSSPYMQGCLQLLPGWIRSHYYLTGAMLVLLSALQIAGATATLLLRKQIKTISCGNVPPINTLLF